MPTLALKNKFGMLPVSCGGHIPAAEYRKVIIGLIFLRYISSAFEKRYNELVAEGEGFEEDRDEYLGENVFFVPEKARWSTIASAAPVVCLCRA